VVGTSGLTDQDYSEIDAAARRQGRGVLAMIAIRRVSTLVGLHRGLDTVLEL
jgi:hypothetical protein